MGTKMEFSDKIRFVRKELGITQEELAKKLGVAFATINRWEQGLTTPHASTEKKLYDFCKENGVEFCKSNPYQLGYKLITATQIENWFADNQRDSQGKFPELIGRLLKESLTTFSKEFRFPQGDKISLDGVDGFLNVVSPKSLYIPEGESFWELGATVKTSKTKILADFEKRDAQIGVNQKKQTTFVLVTPAPLKTKSIEEIKKKILGSSWKEVRVYTSVELEEWLSHNLATSVWMYKNICGQELSLDTLALAHKKLINATTPQLSTKIFTASREKEVEALIESIKDKKVIKVAGPSFYEAYGFVISAMIETALDENNLRTVICRDYASLQKINTLTSDKILILDSNISNYNLSDSKNTTIFIYGKDISDNKIDIQLWHRPQSVLSDILKNEMSVSTTQLRKLSHLAKNNVLLTVRELENGTCHSSNLWRAREDLSLLIPLLMVGKINKKSQSDKKALSVFLPSGETIDQYFSKISHWENIDNSPLLSYGDFIKVSLKEELWSAISKNITSETIEKLLESVKTIFSAPNPKYDLPRDKQFAHQLYNKVWQYSGYLIEGLLDSCILLSIYNEKQLEVDSVIEEILKSISSKEMIFTISDYMKTLAESSPERFLTYIETEIKKDTSLIWELFSNNDADFLFGGGHNYCTLLWALESLCGLDDYKFRVCKILFQLIQKGFSYKISNSPSETLENILWLYNNKNAMSFEDKIFFMEQCIAKYGNEFMPYAIKIVFKTSACLTDSTLKWRDPDLKNEDLTYGVLFNAIDRVITSTINKIDFSNTKILKTLIKHYHQMPRKTFEKITNYIVETYQPNTSEATFLYEYLIKKRYEVIKYHKEDSEQFIKLIEEVIVHLKPTDKIESSLIYFKGFGYNDCPIPETIDEDFDKEERATRKFQNKLLQELLNGFNHREVLDKILQVLPNNGADGTFLADANLLEEDKLFVRGQLINLKKYCSLGSFIAKDGEEEKNSFINCLDIEVLTELIPFIQNYYFIPTRILEDESLTQKFFEHRHMDNNASDIEIQLIKKYNPAGYFQWLLYRQKEEDWDITEIISTMNNINKDNFHPSKHYYIEQILSKLDDKYYTEDIIRLEFAFLPLFDRRDTPNGILRYFLENPKEYCAIISRENKSLPAKTKYEIMGRMRLPKDYTQAQVSNFISTIMENAPSDSVEGRAKKQHLGEILANSFKHTKEEYIPSELKILLEEVDDEEVNKGVYIGYQNNRGVRTVTDGSPEIAMAMKLEEEAKTCEIMYPSAAHILRMIASSSRHEAAMDKEDKLINDGIL